MKKLRREIYLIAIILLICEQAAISDNLTVGLDNNYNFSNIQNAINTAVPGDTILVYPGTYIGSGNSNIDFCGKAITLRSIAGPESTIIDCQKQSKGFYFHQGENSNSIVTGFTITNGYSNNDGIGAGIYCCYSSPSITNCVISNCNRNGIVFYNCSTNIDNCIIKNNTWGIQGVYSNPTLQNCIIKENSGIIGGMYFHSYSNPIITNCVIANNSTTSNACPGIQLGWEASFTISHCTITGNNSISGDASGGGIVYYSSGTVTNSIIWNNWGEEIALWHSDSPGTIEATYCDIDGGFNGEGNINNNPLFALYSEYSLLPGSPCIDAGKDAGIYTDILGRSRPYDFPGIDNNGPLPDFDMGAYEIPEPAAPPIAVAGPNQISYAWIDGIAEVTLDGSASYDDDGDELTYLWLWSNYGNDYEANGVNPTIELPVGQHTIELIVNDGFEDSEPDYVEITVVEPIKGMLRIAPQIIHRRCAQNRIMTKLWLPEGITRDQIDSNSMLLLYPGEVEAMKEFITGGRRVCIFDFFDRDEILEAIGGVNPVEVYVVGQLKTGQYFYGSDTMRIINPGRRLPKWNMRD